MTTKQILGLVILGGGALWLYSSYQKKKEAEENLRIIEERYRNSQIPKQSNDWFRYISAILSIFGAAAPLWEPGGLFAKAGVPNPQTDPKGWAEVLAQIDLF